MIEQLEKQAAEFRALGPGQPFRINEAAVPGDRVWQGDVRIKVIAEIPKGYYRVVTESLQLVPGNTQGARHCLDSLDGVIMYKTRGSELKGPVLVLKKERTIKHPVHGDVTIAAGHTVACDYQREYDSETQRIRRNAD